jgi:hypothetical protein
MRAAPHDRGEVEKVRNEKLHMFSGVHLFYEIDMCRRTASLLAGAPDGVLNNVLVESYAIHLRALIEFLYGNPKHTDDLSAIDYVREQKPWLDARGAIPAPLKDARDRAHKQIAHFTKKRFADGARQKQWQPGLEIPALVAGLRLFLKHADHRKLHPNVSQAVASFAARFVASG